MKASLYDRLWRRESGEQSRYASLSGIYGSKEWINDLDIVNELGGHTGCINALCWSGSGRLLASGSDDKHVNLYSYQPDSSTAPFALNTTIMTGHRANIFSVRFMPHSNDQTLVTCAGDSQVRVFDIEYSNSSSNAAAALVFNTSARSRRFDNFFDGARYLSERNTNARVYRSHADRAKRIVTESSPYLFLTCSEDGEVRQWDLRQPSSAYPQPRGGQGFMAYRPGLDHDDSNVPPPLISYKRYQLDLNTISCSPSQPHYIALGGAHLHCFLHDRRMLGRDLQAERGDPGSSSPRSSGSSRDDEMMGQATRCVRRFAPNGKKRMRTRDNGHITDCKISNANPNEMIVSWSGDHIYSFDLIRSPDARDPQSTRENPITGSPRPRKRKSSKKRKRRQEQEEEASFSSQASGNRHESRRRSQETDDGGELAFRVRYGNGESEDIPLPTLSETFFDAPEEVIERARNAVLTDTQRLSVRIAKRLVTLRKALFSLESALHEASNVSLSDEAESPSTHRFFTSSLAHASYCLNQMNEVMSSWSYPLNPTPDMVNFQQTLRRNREACWRLVQAAGTMLRVLGSVAESSSEVVEGRPGIVDVDLFQQIRPSPGESTLDPPVQFGYDFLKAILLWVEGGRAALLSGFKRDPAQRRNQSRFPIPKAAGDEAIETVLVPYLQGLAGDTPIVNVDASRFEHDSTRVFFPTQHAALTAFANAIRLPLEDLNDTAARVDGHGEESTDTPQVQALDRGATKRFWVLKAGRGILMETASGVNFEYCKWAFGGLRTTTVEDDESDEAEDIELGQERSQEDIDPNEEEEPIRDINLVRRGSGSSGPGRYDGSETVVSDISALSLLERRFPGGHDGDDGDAPGDDGDIEIDDIDDLASASSNGSDASDEDDNDDGVAYGEDEDEDEEDVEIAELLSGSNGFPRARREFVEIDAPCDTHTRVYRGHCNIKTVKDVGFFGLNDEYVVSGSDSGHLFIWDRQSSDLVNILEGDSDVVNVVQGHPYEPTIAAAGIDSTVKVFSPDRKAQDDAHRGINILNPDHPVNALGSDSNIYGLSSCRRMHDSYRIMSQNDVDRQGGMSDAYVTRSMLARLATNLRHRQLQGDGEGTTLVVDPNCAMM
ncbi:hypothetical protein SI65_01710 [Aspergillus cristatus]|uniref:WD repeat-containing protein n=1 Tax=Aspergillus cristatus TaxID=573508 RepID=A0A1E3BT20_ASPCR|nr:hypothetical protein SI65_01710 [Aspergillus cristatus]